MIIHVVKKLIKEKKTHMQMTEMDKKYISNEVKKLVKVIEKLIKVINERP